MKKELESLILDKTVGNFLELWENMNDKTVGNFLELWENMNDKERLKAKLDTSMDMLIRSLTELKALQQEVELLEE